MNRVALEQTIRVLEEVRERNLEFDMRSFVGVRSPDRIGVCRHFGSLEHELRKLHNEVDETQVLWGAPAAASYGGVKDIGDRWAKELETPSVLIPHNCGCDACAVGYAGLDDWFRQQGLRTNFEGSVTFESRTAEGSPVTYIGWDAVEKFYDLDSDESEYLFMPGPYSRKNDPQLVIDHINTLLTTGLPPLGDVYPDDEGDDDDE